MQYFLCSGGTGVDSIKRTSGHVTPNLCFLHPVGSAGHVMHSVRLGHEMMTHNFSSSGGPGAVSIKHAPGHLMLNLCFCIRWDLRVT
jgi:hypothetical protein